MPYARKRKRAYSRKRRRRVKRRYRRKQRALVNKAVKRTLRRIGGNCRYMRHDRSTTINAAQGEYTWKMVTSLFNQDTFEEVLTSTAWDDATAIGAANNPAFQYAFEKNSISLTLRNLAVHPMYLDVYFWTPSKHESFHTGAGALSTGVTDAAARLYQGWADLLSTTQTTALLTLSGDTVECESPDLWPSHSLAFRQLFKVKYKKSYRLDAGDTVVINHKIPNFNYAPSFFANASNLGEDRDLFWIRNITRLIGVRARGAIGMDTTDDEKVNFMEGDIAVMWSWKTTPYKIQVGKQQGYNIATTEDATTNLEGPSDSAMTVDEGG